MPVVIETTLKDKDGENIIYRFSAPDYLDYDRRQIKSWEAKTLNELLDAKNEQKSIIINKTLLDTAYVTTAYIE